jgi:hypothetical protein
MIEAMKMQNLPFLYSVMKCQSALGNKLKGLINETFVTSVTDM